MRSHPDMQLGVIWRQNVQNYAFPAQFLLTNSHERDAMQQSAAEHHAKLMTSVVPLITPKRILIAEDDIVAAHTLRLALSVDGHSVEIAPDGEEALALFEAHDHDVVITDFKLPKMDGLELAEAIKQRAPSRPVILITAYAETVQAQMGGVSNVDILLGKPVSLAKLQEAFQKVFSTPNLTGA